MYTTVIERTREIGVLKSLGASKGYIVRVILSETTLAPLTGACCRIGLSFLLKYVFTHAFPALTIQITTNGSYALPPSRFLVVSWCLPCSWYC